MFLKILGWLAVVVLAAVVVLQVYLSPFLVMLYDSPTAGNTPLWIIVPWFIIMCTFVGLDVYLMWRLLH